MEITIILLSVNYVDIFLLQLRKTQIKKAILVQKYGINKKY